MSLFLSPPPGAIICAPNMPNNNIIPFEFPEDRAFFAELLTENNISRLENEYAEFFDFRSPDLKRREFNGHRGIIFSEIFKRDKGQCQLRLSGCTHDKGPFVIDHFIPLSSNKLNRKLRGQKQKNGKKPKTQSFGSNNIKNLVLACESCNSLKKHRFLDPITRVLI